MRSSRCGLAHRPSGTSWATAMSTSPTFGPSHPAATFPARTLGRNQLQRYLGETVCMWPR